MSIVNNRTLVPPYSVGRNVTDNDWNRIFPKGCRRSGETKEEYEKRMNNADEDEK
jgi:hypothetical protein